MTNANQATSKMVQKSKPVPINREREAFVPLQHYFNKMVSDLIHAPSLLSLWRNNDMFPNVGLAMIEPVIDIHESNGQFKIRAELPGMDEEDVEITINSSYLNIKGQKQQENREEDENCITCECSYGSFQRTLQLPEIIDTSKAKASFKNGVLTIELPKKAEMMQETRKLDIQRAA